MSWCPVKSLSLFLILHLWFLPPSLSSETLFLVSYIFFQCFFMKIQANKYGFFSFSFYTNVVHYLFCNLFSFLVIGIHWRSFLISRWRASSFFFMVVYIYIYIYIYDMPLWRDLIYVTSPLLMSISYLFLLS